MIPNIDSILHGVEFGISGESGLIIGVIVGLFMKRFKKRSTSTSNEENTNGTASQRAPDSD